MDILEMLAQAQKPPSDYWGSLCDLVEDNRARTGIGRHRDSGVLDISNYETVYADLLDRFGNENVFTDSASHWAVGWSDEILVTAWNDPDGEETLENVHPAFLAAMEWHGKLEDYPVADEEDYSRREYEDALETLEYGYSVPADKVSEVFSWLFDNFSVSSGEDMRQEYVDAALAALGLSEEEEG
jgi:hypothetical protein